MRAKFPCAVIGNSVRPAREIPKLHTTRLHRMLQVKFAYFRGKAHGILILFFLLFSIFFHHVHILIASVKLVVIVIIGPTKNQIVVLAM